MRDRNSGKFLLRLALLVVVPLAAIAGGFYFYLISGRYITTENAYVKTDIIQISADVDGRVIEMAVRDHDVVQTGDLLFRIDPSPYQIAVERAEAEIEAARTQIETLRAEYGEAVAQVREEEQRIAFLGRQVDRQQRLQQTGAASAQRLDEARFELAVARERRAAAQQKANRILSALGGDAAIDTDRHPLTREKLAMRREAELDLRRTAVFAPTDGIVTNVRLQAGEHVVEGQPVFSLVSSLRPWIEANLKETDLTHVRVGHAARVVVDAYPGIEWEAEVESISPATGAEFAILPPQNATGNWVKVVQRLPVRLRLLDQPTDLPLRAGMTVRATIDTEHEREMLVSLRSSWERVADVVPGAVAAGGL